MSYRRIYHRGTEDTKDRGGYSPYGIQMFLT